MLGIILGVVGGVVLVIVLIAVLAHIHGKKKEKKLDENIKKLKEEKSSLDSVGQLTIIDDEPKEMKVETVDIEDKKEPAPEESESADIDEDDDFDNMFKDFEMNFNDNKKVRRKKKPKDDFEAFLDKHSYTRRVLDKDILKKIQELPPEVKAIVISNIFSRPQD